MDRYAIDFWLRRFHEMGLFVISFKEPEYTDLVDEFSKLDIANPIQLFGAVDMCIND